MTDLEKEIRELKRRLKVMRATANLSIIERLSYSIDYLQDKLLKLKQNTN